MPHLAEHIFAEGSISPKLAELIFTYAEHLVILVVKLMSILLT